jgi:hypothetical protein
LREESIVPREACATNPSAGDRLALFRLGDDVPVAMWADEREAPPQKPVEIDDLSSNLSGYTDESRHVHLHRVG